MAKLIGCESPAGLWVQGRLPRKYEGDEFQIDLRHQSDDTYLASVYGPEDKYARPVESFLWDGLTVRQGILAASR